MSTVPTPTAEDVARDAAFDRALLDMVRPDDRGSLWAMAGAYLRRAHAAEDPAGHAARRADAALAQVAELDAEVARLQRRIAGHCARIAAQSELLSRRAEGSRPAAALACPVCAGRGWTVRPVVGVADCACPAGQALPPAGGPGA